MREESGGRDAGPAPTPPRRPDAQDSGPTGAVDEADLGPSQTRHGTAGGGSAVHTPRLGRTPTARTPAVEGLERRALMATVRAAAAAAAPPPTLSQSDVDTLLQRAAAATASNDGIIAVVDRGGHILGVRVEGGVSPAITGNTEKLVFAVDGAVAEARTGAFFGSNQAPLTSRTIQIISQSTMTQREINSDPN